MTKKILAIIPARGGSKGLAKKNIIDLNAKPLIAWSIEASLSSKYITKTVASSDSNEILDISKRYGADIMKRPSELASDTASSESVIIQVIEELKKNGEEFDYLILLQPTSPLRDSINIDNAFDLLFNSEATALISVCETDNKILKAFKETADGYIEGISNNTYPFVRRQDLPKTYMSNGAIYIIKINEFIKTKALFTNKTISFLMNKGNSIDIDSLKDLKEVEAIMKDLRE